MALPNHGERTRAFSGGLANGLGSPRARGVLLLRHAKGPEVVIRVDSTSLIRGALEAGIAISILPCLVGDTTLGLRRVGPYFEGGTYMWVLTHPELRATARVRAFVDYVREMIGSDCGLISGAEP